MSIHRAGGLGNWAVGVPALAKEKENEKGLNPGNPFAEIFAQIAILNDKLDEVLGKGDGEDLRGVTENWDKKLDATNGQADGCNSDRFTCVLDGLAVRDNETGLVWQRFVSPEPPPFNVYSWDHARNCSGSALGNRMGWRLPSFPELASLIEPSEGQGLGPPSGQDIHFRISIPRSAIGRRRIKANPNVAYLVSFHIDTYGVTRSDKAQRFKRWCVRGGMNGESILRIGCLE